MANIMPLSIFKMLNPSEFGKDGNSISGFNRDMTKLSAYGNRPIQQHGVRLINFIFNKKYFKTRFHIVDVEGHILLGLTQLRNMRLFHKHKLMIIETIYIHQEQKNLTRYDSKVVDKCSKCTNENILNQNVKMRTQQRLGWLMSLWLSGAQLYTSSEWHQVKTLN